MRDKAVFYGEAMKDYCGMLCAQFYTRQQRMTCLVMAHTLVGQVNKGPDWYPARC
jgi:hypothetical protein